MKIEFDKEKSTKAISGLVKGTVDFSKKAALSAKSSVATMVEKSKEDSYARRMKKYNPLFPEQYSSDSFNLPNMIIIKDDAVRRGIDVCEGAIGWLSNNGGLEVLYLYDEFIPSCGLQFIPSVTCEAAYYVDSFDRKRFIRTDCIFSKAHEERLAELKHIAYSLGAKYCSIEICESTSSMQSQNKSFEFSEKILGTTSNESAEQSFTKNNSTQRSGHIECYYEGHNTPQIPTLKWFAHDDIIKNLIEMCCTGSRSIKKETLELAGSSSATMSLKTAYSIDAAIGKSDNGAKGHASMNSEAAKEHHSKLLFHIEF